MADKTVMEGRTSTTGKIRTVDKTVTPVKITAVSKVCQTCRDDQQ